MNFGPSLIGAVVGAAVGVAAQVLLESTMNQEAGWFALVIGLLTGFGARALAGEAIRTTSYLRAGLVAFIALGGILGGSYAASEITRREGIRKSESMPTVDIQAPIDADDEPGKDPSEEEPTKEDSADSQPADRVSADEEPGDGEESEDAPTGDDSSDEQPTGDEAIAEKPTGDVSSDAESVKETAPADKSTRSTGPKTDAQSEVAVEELSIWHAVFVGLGTFLAYEVSRGNTKKE